MKIILFTITTLLLFNCSNGANEPNEPPIPCNDGICLTDEQLNFFKMHLEDDTLTKKVLFEMSSMDLSSKEITSLPAGIFNNLINLTSVDLTDNPICSVDKGDVGLADIVNLTFEIGQCLTDEQLNFFKMHLEDDTLTKKVLFEMSSMDLQNKSITSLDTGIFNNLTNLNSVDLTDNDICIVDKSDVGLADGVNLNFDGWNCLTNEQLTFFSDHIMSITTKQELYEAPTLNLNNKSISTLPTGIFNNLTNVTNLRLDLNQLESVPTDIGNLANLTELDLNKNQLTSIPAEIGNLTNLTNLYLRENNLSSIPAEIGNLTSLTTLNLGSNALTDIPTEIGNLTSLTTLNLGSNALTDIPTEIGNLASLTGLDLRKNKLTDIPTEIGNLTSLTSLNLGSNALTDIPTEIGNLISLTTLNLGSNAALTDIPTEIGNLTNLTQLLYNNNQLTSIPDGIFTNLTSLTFLWLHNNNLTSIPAEIGNLTSLTNLLLNSNQLASIPAGIFNNLTNLTTLWLHNSFSSNEMNSFDCNDTNYTAWGLTDPTTTITSFICR